MKTAREILGRCECINPQPFWGWGYPSDKEQNRRIKFCKLCVGFITPPFICEVV